MVPRVVLERQPEVWIDCVPLSGMESHDHELFQDLRRRNERQGYWIFYGPGVSEEGTALGQRVHHWSNYHPLLRGDERGAPSAVTDGSANSARVVRDEGGIGWPRKLEVGQDEGEEGWMDVDLLRKKRGKKRRQQSRGDEQGKFKRK